jgi:hypothetical protein
MSRLANIQFEEGKPEKTSATSTSSSSLSQRISQPYISDRLFDYSQLYNNVRVTYRLSFIIILIK